MRTRLICAVFCTSLFALSTVEASAENVGAPAERRVALVIGNSNYTQVPTLPNPQNDARAIAEVLKRLNFEVVLALDVTRQTMAEPLSQFSRLLTGADVGLFFYAGHGLSFEGRNYLVPVDATADNHIQVKFEMTAIDQIAEEMARAVRLNIVMLDACRNNPLAEKLERSLGSSRAASVLRGLAVMKPVGQESSIVFATAPGDVAADGSGAHSPFTKALLDHIEKPGLTIEAVFRNVRRDVRAATGNQQLPEMWHRLENTFQFNGQSPAAGGPTAGPQTGQTGASRNTYSVEDDRLYWESVKDLGDASLLQSYIDEFPGGRYVAIAKTLIARLSSISANTPATPRNTTPESASGSLLKPSFNCAEDLGLAEQTICGSRTLAELDLRLAVQYFEVYGQLNRARGLVLRKEQRDWLKKRNSCQADASCLETTYRQRLERLANIGKN